MGETTNTLLSDVCIKQMIHSSVLLAVMLFLGSIGGIARGAFDKLSNYDLNKEFSKSNLNSKPNKIEWSFWFQHIFVGMAGAACAVFATLLLSKYKLEINDIQSLILFSTLSVLGGVMAKRCLPALGNRILREIEQKVNARNKEFEKKIRQSEIKLEKSELICAAIAAIKNKKDTEMHYLLSKISSIYDKFNTDRPLTIQLARLYRWTNQLDKGISILQSYLDKFPIPDSLEGIKKIDYADVLYNLACYKYIQLKDHPKEYLTSEVFKPLSDSIRMNPRNMKQMEEDPDLKDIKEDLKKHLTKKEE